jgi:hypothetical protein
MGGGGGAGGPGSLEVDEAPQRPFVSFTAFPAWAAFQANNKPPSRPCHSLAAAVSGVKRPRPSRSTAWSFSHPLGVSLQDAVQGEGASAS